MTDQSRLDVSTASSVSGNWYNAQNHEYEENDNRQITSCELSRGRLSCESTI